MYILHGKASDIQESLYLAAMELEITAGLAFFGVHSDLIEISQSPNGLL
jgi:hypothetical protein